MIRILELLAAEPDKDVSLTDVSRSLDISRATAHAILATLTAHRWVVRDEQTNGYSWGPAIGALARVAGDRRFRGYLQDLHAITGMQVFIARRESSTLTVIDSIGDSLSASPVRTGFRMPLVAPFGRDYVAWASENDQRTWLTQICEPSSALYQRMTAVLAEVRRRGVVIERLTREYLRVYTAMRAMVAEGGPDPITKRLGAAFADLTLVDYLPGELEERRAHSIATVSAPIRDVDGRVTMSVTAAPYAQLTRSALNTLSEQVRSAASHIESTLT
ncbi:MAG TPA: helix-turn-helix domain-containing protein [Mycobacterium sp.]|nr:helix-turn-helix domain-containing protein [Mycobacterium sp.]